jgi:hypothetical protein
VSGCRVFKMSRWHWHGGFAAKARWAAMLGVIAVTTAGCAAQLADLGEPIDTPPRPAVAPAYPAVNAMPAARAGKPLTAEESRRIAEELTALRARQELETTGSIPAPTPGR